MTTIQKKKQDENKNRLGSVVKGVAGAVAIAGVAVAATMVLKDEKNRKKVKNALTNVKDQAIDYVDTLKTESNDEEANVAKKTSVGTKKTVDEST